MSTSPHSAEFIAEMKQRLMEEKATLEKELAALGQRKDGDFQSDFPDYGRNDEENATEVADYEASVSTAETLEARLQSVISALAHIKAGTYGVTDDGEPIPEDRLRANPAAATVIKK